MHEIAQQIICSKAELYFHLLFVINPFYFIFYIKKKVKTIPYEVKKNGQFYLIRVQLQNHRCTHLLLLSRCVDIKNVLFSVYWILLSQFIFITLFNGRKGSMFPFIKFTFYTPSNITSSGWCCYYCYCYWCY